MVHGSLEDDDARAGFLATALGVVSRASFPAARERRLELLADLVEHVISEHVGPALAHAFIADLQARLTKNTPDKPKL